VGVAVAVGSTLAIALALPGCGAGGRGDDAESATAASTTSAVPSSSTASSVPPSTAVAEGAGGAGGLAGADDLVAAVVGRTYGEANVKGVSAHQESLVGTKGSWTLFTAEKDGVWYAFTTENPHPDGRPGALEDGSKVVSGERLAPLPEGEWYGVDGVVRDGRPLGGVMMHGRGYDREPDGTFPVVDAWRVNLRTLALEPTSIEGLDIVESCG
jgi:hypothetical protein